MLHYIIVCCYHTVSLRHWLSPACSRQTLAGAPCWVVVFLGGLYHPDSDHPDSKRLAPRQNNNTSSWHRWARPRKLYGDLTIISPTTISATTHFTNYNFTTYNFTNYNIQTKQFHQLQFQQQHISPTTISATTHFTNYNFTSYNFTSYDVQTEQFHQLQYTD